MIKIWIIAALGLLLKFAFYKKEFMKPIKAFPFFTSPQCDFNEVLEGFKWKEVMKDKRRKISEMIKNLGDEDETQKMRLSERLKFNPKFYVNDFKLLPNPIIIEMLYMVYTKAGELGIFGLYALLDLVANLMLLKVFLESTKNPSKNLAFLMINLNPLSVISV